MNLNKLLKNGITETAETALEFYINNKTGRAFISRMTGSFIKSSKIRDEYEAAGTHIPPFIIASITSSCNLHCAGCYARANRSCSDEAQANLSAEEWQRIFKEASSLGISFILLAGGEPLLRRDIIEAAAENENIVSPYLPTALCSATPKKLFEMSRNLIPVLSIEGDGEDTDSRRGRGVSEKLKEPRKA
jgi:MoaA/NifB/PqqE/SkfB family radical SAM enzyme